MVEQHPQELSRKDLVDNLLRLAGIGALAVYAAGILIINLHLHRFGASGFNLLETEYAIAGTVWMTFILSGCFAAYFVELGTQRFNNREIAAGASLWGLGFFPILGLLAVTTESMEWVLYIVTCLILWLSGMGLLGLFRQLIQIEDLRSLLWPRSLSTSRGDGTHFLRAFCLSVPLLLVLQIGAYSLFVFSYISARYGGGAPRNVRLYIRTDSRSTIDSLGIKMDDENSTTELSLLWESAEGYLFSGPYDNGRRSGIFIKRDLVEASTYFCAKLFDPKPKTSTKAPDVPK
jgi:hypothetical protein